MPPSTTSKKKAELDSLLQKNVQLISAIERRIAFLRRDRAALDNLLVTLQSRPMRPDAVVSTRRMPDPFSVSSHEATTSHPPENEEEVVLKQVQAVFPHPLSRYLWNGQSDTLLRTVVQQELLHAQKTSLSTSSLWERIAATFNRQQPVLRRPNRKCVPPCLVRDAPVASPLSCYLRFYNFIAPQDATSEAEQAAFLEAAPTLFFPPSRFAYKCSASLHNVSAFDAFRADRSVNVIQQSDCDDELLLRLARTFGFENFDEIFLRYNELAASGCKLARGPLQKRLMRLEDSTKQFTVPDDLVRLLLFASAFGTRFQAIHNTFFADGPTARQLGLRWAALRAGSQ